MFYPICLKCVLFSFTLNFFLSILIKTNFSQWIVLTLLFSQPYHSLVTFFFHFRIILILISNLLTNEDIRRLKELLPENHVAKDSKNVFEIFIAMEHLGMITESDLSVLIKFAQASKIQAVLTLLTDYLQDSGNTYTLYFCF